MGFTFPDLLGTDIVIVKKKSMSHVSQSHPALPSCLLFDISKGLFLYSII